MNKETRNVIAKDAILSTLTVAEAVFIHWVGNVNWWIAWLLAAGFTSSIEQRMTLRDNRRLFDIADAELVRVSALANALEEKIEGLESEIESLKLAAL